MDSLFIERLQRNLKGSVEPLPGFPALLEASGSYGLLRDSGEVASGVAGRCRQPLKATLVSLFIGSDQHQRFVTRRWPCSKQPEVTGGDFSQIAASGTANLLCERGSRPAGSKPQNGLSIIGSPALTFAQGVTSSPHTARGIGAVFARKSVKGSVVTDQGAPRG